MENWAKSVAHWVGTPTSLIIHTIIFIGSFGLKFFGYKISDIMLCLTTIVSLEAIYLTLLIQMTMNQQVKELTEVKTAMEEVQETVEEIQEESQQDN